MKKLFKIVKDNKKSLRNKSSKFELPLKDEDIALAKDMLEYLKLSQDDEYADKHNLRPGVGLAGPQIGINKCIFAVHYENYDESGNLIDVFSKVLINPVIISESSKRSALRSGEGCLSVDGEHKGIVLRADKIKLKAFSALEQKEVIINASDLLSIILQHEYDHLNGILFYDRINQLVNLNNKDIHFI